MSVLLIGTLDTKGNECKYLRDRLSARGVSVLVADAGVLGPPTFTPDFSRETLFSLAGSNCHSIKAAADRGPAITRAALGAAKLAADLFRSGRLTGVLGLGGSAGTTIGSAAMRALPIGIPKLLVSTLASGQVQPFIGTRDVMMLYSVVDIAGINRISRQILDNAAAAMWGMVGSRNEPALPANEDKPIVTATMFGVTTPCVDEARSVLEKAGYEVLVFHATGSGGRTMEGLIRDGLVAGVLDITTTELADELVGGILSAGADRLTAAAMRGIPQVISVGALDMVNFGPMETVPAQHQSRRLNQHNPNVTLMRTTPDECDRLGKEIAQKASAGSGPTAIMLPRLGVSAIDATGQPFWWPEANQALFESIRNWIAPAVELVEYDLHINDAAFARACANKLLEMMRSRPETILTSQSLSR